MRVSGFFPHNPHLNVTPMRKQMRCPWPPSSLFFAVATSYAARRKIPVAANSDKPARFRPGRVKIFREDVDARRFDRDQPFTRSIPRRKCGGVREVDGAGL